MQKPILITNLPRTKHTVDLIGYIEVLEEYRKKLGIASTKIKGGVPVCAASEKFNGKIDHGKVSKAAGAASIAWVRQAVEWVQADYSAAMVTATLCKESVEKTIPKFQWHTEFISEMCGNKEPVLALVHGNWVLAHVSTHVSLAEAIKRAKVIKKQKIDVAGINPHAGKRQVGGVNTTLGLPVLRTSVDHGTGFDIAWQNNADPASLKDAMLLADRLAL